MHEYVHSRNEHIERECSKMTVNSKAKNLSVLFSEFSTVDFNLY